MDFGSPDVSTLGFFVTNFRYFCNKFCSVFVTNFANICDNYRIISDICIV